MQNTCFITSAVSMTKLRDVIIDDVLTSLPPPKDTYYRDAVGLYFSKIGVQLTHNESEIDPHQERPWW